MSKIIDVLRQARERIKGRHTVVVVSEPFSTPGPALEFAALQKKHGCRYEPKILAAPNFDETIFSYYVVRTTEDPQEFDLQEWLYGYLLNT